MDQPQPAAPKPARDGLTPRQVEVLRLLAAGLTNRQIAEKLVVSVNTVDRHVADLYRKIGVSNRVRAAKYAAEAGLYRPEATLSGPLGLEESSHSMTGGGDRAD